MKCAAAAVLSVLLVASEPLAASEPVRILGKYAVQYKDTVVHLALSHRYSSNRPGGWLVLEAGLTAAGNTPVEVTREDVTLVMPGGTELPLPSQKLMADDLRDARRVFQEASLMADPLEGYFPVHTRLERIAFFAVPNEQIVFDQVTVDRQTLAMGYLFFKAPEGAFPEGRYRLRVFNKWVDAELPFHIPEEPSKKKSKGDDKTVPW